MPGYEHEVDERYCSYLPVPTSSSSDGSGRRTLTKACNLHCRLEWRVLSRSACSARCGPGKQAVEYGCTRVMASTREQDMTLPDRYCLEQAPEIGTKPPAASSGERRVGEQWGVGGVAGAGHRTVNIQHYQRLQHQPRD